MLSTSGFPGVDGLAPAILEDAGKTVTAFPLDNHFRSLERFSPESFVDEVRTKGKAKEKGRPSVIAIMIDPLSLPALCSAPEGGETWFAQALGLISSQPAIELSTTNRVYKPKSWSARAYLSSGMTPYDHADSGDPADVRLLARTSIKKCLLDNWNTHNVYAKMMHVHVLVGQLRGDKSRKKNAREELWQAQQNEVFRSQGPQETPHSRLLRSQAYKHLLIAEKLSRVRGVFSPSVVTADFDLDTAREYLCQLEKINAYVHARGGRVFELDVFSVYRNYCDLCTGESGGLFLDHLYTDEELSALTEEAVLPNDEAFSSTPYQEISVDSSRQEIVLKSSSVFGALQQPISLKKQYAFRDEGLTVQYILKNESPLQLSGWFACELGLSLTKNRNKLPLMTVYTQDTRKDCLMERCTYRDVSWLQVADSGSLVTFTLEANENPSISVIPVLCSVESDSPDGVRLFLFWKAELGPGYETEKTVFFKIDS
jgi:hypothetical protein